MSTFALQQLRRITAACPDGKFLQGRISRPEPGGPARGPVGLMAADPWFRANTPIGEWLNDDGSLAKAFSWPDSIFNVVTDIFGLSQPDANFLFHLGSGCTTDGGKDKFLANLDRVIGGEPAVPQSSHGGWHRRTGMAVSG